MTQAEKDSPREECYRCGYDLRGISNDQPCPECGLLAERSRRITDELHQTRPRWLRTVSKGTKFILLAICVAFTWPWICGELFSASFRMPFWSDWYSHFFNSYIFFRFRYGQSLFLLGFDIAAVFLLLGTIMLSCREGYLPADRDDHGLRITLRIAAFLPFAAIIFQTIISLLLSNPTLRMSYFRLRSLQPEVFAFLLFVLIPFPLLLFLRLRSLAKRSRSSHLAEHCLIVGTGSSGAFLFIFLVTETFQNTRSLGLGDYWIERSSIAMGIMLILSVLGALFPLWSLYLLFRFMICFHKAARRLRLQWKHDDRAIS